MANANKPSGFSPVKYLNGADWDGRGNLYYIDSTIANALFPGDPVKLVTGLDQKYGIPSIDLAAAADTPVGVIIAMGVTPGGPYVDPNNLSLTSVPATKTKSYFALIADDPATVFEIQETGTALTYTAVNKNANWVNGTPATGVVVSATQLDTSTIQTTNTLGLALLGLSRKSDNAFGTNAKWLVKFNRHALVTGRTGV